MLTRSAVPTLLLLIGFSVHAQETSSAKRELIRELLAVTNATENAEAIMDSMSAQLQGDLLRVLSQVIESGRSLSGARRAEVQREVAASAQRTSERFRELFRQRVNFSGIVEEVSYEVYGRHFSESEIRDLIEFYKTPTGRKSIEVMPRLFSDSLTMTSERLDPLVQPIIQEIIGQEVKRIEGLVSKVPARRRRR